MANDTIPVPQGAQFIPASALTAPTAPASDSNATTVPVPQGAQFISASDLTGTGPQDTQQAAPAPSTVSNIGTGLGEAGHDIYNAVTSLAPPTNTNAAKTIPGKVLGMAEDVANGISNLTGITTVTDSLKNASHMFDAYEQARSGGASVTQALSAANERGKQADKITPMLKAAGQAWQKNPTAETTRALADIAATAASIYGGNAVTGKLLVAPEPIAEPVEAESAAKPSPVEAKTTAAINKVKLPEGRTATSPVETQQAIADQAAKQADIQAETGKNIQSNLQAGLRDTWSRVAQDNGVPAPNPNVSIREAGQQVGDAIYARSKATYKMVDDATDGKFQPNEDALKNVNLKLRDIAGLDDTAEAKLQAQKQRLEWQQDQLFDEATKNGVPKDTVQAAKKDYKTAQAIYDVNHNVRMTTTGLPPGVASAAENPEIVKSGSLMNRLIKDYSPEEGGKLGRLTQAVGDENAHSLLNHASTAQVAENKLAASVIDKNPEFSGLPATESKALREIIRPNVTAGRFRGANIDWKGALNDFDSLKPEELKARFSDSTAVRAALRRQATIQAGKTALKVGTGLLGLGAGEEVIRRNLP